LPGDYKWNSSLTKSSFIAIKTTKRVHNLIGKVPTDSLYSAIKWSGCYKIWFK